MEIPEYDQDPTSDELMAEYEAQQQADEARLVAQHRDERLAASIHELIQLANRAATSPAADRELRRVMGAMLSGTTRAR